MKRNKKEENKIQSLSKARKSSKS